MHMENILFSLGFWAHTLMANALNSLPGFVCDKVMANQLYAMRAKALKKKAKEQ